MEYKQAIKTDQSARQEDAQPSARAKLSDHTPLTHLMRLQQEIGNRNMGRFLQAKLQVSQPGNQYEQEADRVADQVMRMPDQAPVTLQPGGPPQISLLQRKCAECEEEVQRQAIEGEMEEEEEGSLQAKEADGQAAEVTSGAQAQIDGL